jgi:hypothetical protein
LPGECAEVIGLHVAVRDSDTLEEAMNAGLSAGSPATE